MSTVSMASFLFRDSMTLQEIVRVCAERKIYLMIDSHRNPDGSVSPVVRIYRQPDVTVDLKAQVRSELER